MTDEPQGASLEGVCSVTKVFGESMPGGPVGSCTCQHTHNEWTRPSGHTATTRCVNTITNKQGVGWKKRLSLLTRSTAADQPASKMLGLGCQATEARLSECSSARDPHGLQSGPHVHRTRTNRRSFWPTALDSHEHTNPRLAQEYKTSGQAMAQHTYTHAPQHSLATLLHSHSPPPALASLPASGEQGS